MEAHGSTWNPMESHGIPCEPMESHGISWNPMESHGLLPIIWNLIVFYNMFSTIHTRVVKIIDFYIT
jgi:hypothetical protein